MKSTSRKVRAHMETNQNEIISIVENLITGICSFELKDGKLKPLYVNEGLGRMLGYNEKELKRYIKYLRFSIIPDDLPIFDQAIVDVLRADGPVDCEFRTVTARDTIRWLYVRANLYSKLENTYRIFSVVSDVTDRKNAELELQLQAQRLNAASQVQNEKVIEYNARTDVMTIRSQSKTGLPEERIMPGYIAQFDLTEYHPDDIELYLEVFRGLLISPKSEVLEIRLNAYDGQFTWYQLYLTSLASAEGYVTRIVGRMVNIHERKEKELALAASLDIDYLTQIDKQNVVQDKINKFLEETSATSSLHALFVVDLDNFKAINECLGHSAGDTILRECANLVIEKFRRPDIVGRIGGDEFVILAKDIGTISNADIIATKLLEHLQWNIPYNNDTIPVSGSIGISIYPYHGKTYGELFAKSQMALQSIKANGKSDYQIYDSGATRVLHINRMQSSQNVLNTSSQEKMDSLKNSLTDKIFHILHEDKNEKSVLISILEIINSEFGWQRSYICPPSAEIDSDTRFINACKLGYESGRRTFDNMKLIADFCEDLYEMNHQLQVLQEYDSFPEELHRYLVNEKIKRIFYYPLEFNGDYCGAIIFEDCVGFGDITEKEEFTELNNALRIVDSYLVQFKFNDKKTRDLVTQLEMLDNLDNYVYLVDPDTYRVKFFNSLVQQINPQIKPGGLCYEMIRQSNSPCEDCIMSKLSRSNRHDRLSAEMFQYPLRAWTKQSACWLECTKENAVCMITGTDISDYFIG